MIPVVTILLVETEPKSYGRELCDLFLYCMNYYIYIKKNVGIFLNGFLLHELVQNI